MKVIVERDDIYRQLDALNKLVLGGALGFATNQEKVKIAAHDGKIEFSSYNSELNVMFEAPAEIKEEGEVVVQGRALSSYLNKLFPARMLITAKGKQLIVENADKDEQAFDVAVPYADDEAWVDVQHFDGKMFSMPVGILSSNVNKAIKAAAQQNFQKPVLRGALFDINEDHLVVVASDSHRMCVRTAVHGGQGLSKAYGCIISADTLSKLTKLIRLDCNDQTPISIGFEYGKKVYFEVDGSFVLSAPIIGEKEEFPPFENFLVPTVPIDVTMSTRKFSETFGRVTIFIEDRDRQAVNFSISEEDVHMKVGPTQIGTADETIVVDTCATFENDGAYDTGINANYLQDAISIIDGEQLRFRVADESKRGLMFFTEADEELSDMKNFYLVGPFMK